MRNLTFRSEQIFSWLLVISLLLSACVPAAHGATLRAGSQQQPADDDANNPVYLPQISHNSDPNAPTPTRVPPTSTPVPSTSTPVPPATLQLNRIDNQIARLGRTLRFTLSASNSNGLALVYSVAPLPLPANATFDPASGQFSFQPQVSQVGEFSLTFTVSNGTASDSETIKINVPQPSANGATTLSGIILDANEAAAGRDVPLVGATVQLMNSTSMSTTTASDGSFHFTGIPEGEQYFEYNGAKASSSVPGGGSYGAYRGRKMIIAHVDNVMERPIYIMKIDMAGKTTVNPNAQTDVNNPNIGVSLKIPAQTVLNDQGQLYNGDISVSPVPVGFTPASLPNNLNPSRVVTIQPMGLTFQQPAPIKFPNSDNLAPGSEVNIWSMDHKLNKFFIAGKGRVSADGQWVESIPGEGGIRESSWHFILPLLLILLPSIADAAGANNSICKAKTNSGSLLHLADGCLESSIQLPGYLSLGQARQLEFSYLSQRAWPVPILPFQATLPVEAAIPAVIQSNLRNFGGLTSGLAAPVTWDKSKFNENQDEPLRGAVSVDGSSLRTGVYPYSIRLTNQYDAASVSSDVNGSYPLVNEQSSAFGAGWGLAGLQRLYPQPDNSLLLANGDGSALIFTLAQPFVLGGFNEQRGGGYSLTEGGNHLSVARTLLEQNFSKVSYRSFDTLSQATLADVDMLIITSARDTFQHITPLSSVEQAALRGFVQSGHCAVVITDNSAFGGAGTPAANESLLDPFGMDTTGTINNGRTIAAVDKPQLDSLTNGRFGTVTQFPQGWPGGFSNLGSYAQSLATNALGSALALIEKDRISPNSGPVIFYSDHETFASHIYSQHINENANLFLNTIDYCLNNIALPSPPVYAGPLGDYSTLTKNTDNTYTRRLKDGTEYRFNAAGLQTALIDRNGNTTQYAYDGNNRLTTITDPVGLVTTLAYNGAHLQSVTDPTKRVTTFEHNPVGDLVKVNFPDGSNKQFGYDHHLMTAETDERGKTTTRHYDNYGRLVSADLPESVTRSTQYAQKVGLVSDPNVGTITNPAPIVRPDEVKTTVTDGESRTTTYTFGPIQSIASVLDPAGLKTTIERDQDSNPIKYTYPSGQVINQTFDGNGNLLTVNDPTVQGTTSFGYEPLFNQPVTIQDPFGNTTTISYDGKGNPTQIVSPLNRTVRMSYNSQGLPVVVTDTLGTVANFSYNQGNLTQLQWGSGAVARTATFTYTNHGYLHSMSDPLGRSFGYKYDALGRLTNETLPGSRTVVYQYDAAGNLTSLTPPDRPAHRFEYDDLGQLTAYIPPVVAGVSNPRTGYAYNKAQQLTKLTRPDGKGVEYNYDNASRLTTIKFGRGAVSYTYDATTGQLTTISAPENVNLGFQYQGALLTGATWSGALNGTVQRGYDAGYRTTSISVNGVTTGYQYDQDSAPTQAGDLTLSYQPASGLLANTTLGSINDSFSYNTLGELQGYTANVNTTPIFRTSYTRDALGRITGLTETIINTTTVYGYSYDAAGRLAQVTSTRSATASYTYDANGNRLSASDATGTVNGSYDDQDRLLSYGNALYSYSANGELQSKTASGQQTTYSYDEFGNLTRVTLPSGDVITYLIDGQDRRIGKKVNGVLQKGWLYEDQLRPVAEVDGSGAVVSRFIYATRVNVPDYMVRAGKTYRLVLDHLGSVRLVVNVQNGGVVQLLDYDAWGVVTRDSNPGFQPFGFAGGLYDGQTGLVRFGARDYDAGVGRWTSKDPIGFVDNDTSLYIYSANIPTNLIDPNGRIAFIPILIGMGIGAGLELGSQLLQNGGKLGCVNWWAVSAWGSSGGVGGLLNGGRFLGNTWSLLGNSRIKYSWGRLLWDNRIFKNVSRQYWRVSGGANGYNLHHWLFQNQSKWIPQGLRNSGLNLLELPAGINQWAGGRWPREWALRSGILGVGGGAGYQGYQIGSGLGGSDSSCGCGN